MLLEELQYQLPQFVVANAVVHMDEDSPHMHVVGVPVSTRYKKGMSKQVSKKKGIYQGSAFGSSSGQIKNFCQSESGNCSWGTDKRKV